MKRGEAGFTLIEALATLGIAGVVSTLLLGSFAFSGAAWSRSTALADASSDIYSAQGLLRRLALNFSNGTGGAHFAGNAESLALTTRFGFPGTAPAPTEAGLAIGTCEETPCLVLTLSRAAATRGAPPVLIRTPLIRNVSALRVSYLAAGSQEWHGAWKAQDGAPRLVRVEVAFAGRDARRWPVLYLPVGSL